MTTTDPPTTARATAIPRVWTLLNVCGAGIALALAIGRLALNHSVNRGWWGYSAGEWFINYGDGFVRRGLGGEIVRRAPAPSDLIALEVGISVIVAANLALIAVLIQRSMTRTNAAWPLAVWLLPSGALVAPLQSIWQPFWVTSTQFTMRKEQVLLLIVAIAAVWWSRSTPFTRSRLLWSAGCLGVLLFSAALIHEGLVLPALAAILLLGWRTAHSTAERFWGGLLIVLPTLAGVVLAITHAGQESDARAIWMAIDEPSRAWYENSTTEQFSPLVEGVPLAIAILGSSLDEATRTVAAFFIDDWVWLWWVITAGAIAGIAILILVMIDRSGPALRSLTATTVVIGVGTAPLFLVGYDWGRWIAFAVNLIVAVALAHTATAPHPRPTGANRLAILLVAVALLLSWLVGVQEVGNPQGVLSYGIGGGLPEPAER